MRYSESTATRRRVAAEPEQLHGLRHRAVDLARSVDRHGLRRGSLPLLPHVEGRARMAGHRQAHEVGHGAAAHEQSARLGGEPHHLLEPIEHLVFHETGAVVEASYVRVEAGGQHLREGGERRARAHDPAPEAGVDVAGGQGEDVLSEVRVGAFFSLACAWQRFVHPGPRLRGRLLPHGSIAHRPEVFQHVVDHLMTQLAQGLPVFWIEGLLESRPRLGWGSQHDDHSSRAATIRNIGLTS